MKFHVRPVDGAGDWDSHEGDLSIGGALFHSPKPAAGDRYEIKFRLPDRDHDVVCKAEVLRVRDAAEGKRVHLKFYDLELTSELAIAKYIDDLIVSLGS